MARFIFWGLFVSVLGGFCAAQDVLTTLSYNFTLAAWDTTRPNSNSTGVPLVLGSRGSSRGVTSYATSTYASYGFNDYPSLGLVDGTFRAYSEGEWWTNATTVDKNGGGLGWVRSKMFPIEATRYYSSVSTTNQSSLLAVYGIHNLWSLCPSFGQMSLFFNVSETSLRTDYYDPKQCYRVLINIIPQS